MEMENHGGVHPFDRESAARQEADAYLKRLRLRVSQHELYRAGEHHRDKAREEIASREAQTYYGAVKSKRPQKNASSMEI